MLQSAIRTFKLYDPDTVRAAAVAAAESLGHTVESSDGGEVVIKTAKSETTKAGKTMRVSITNHQGVTTAMVMGAMFFGQKRTVKFGEQLFKAMDVVLAS